MLYRRSAVVSGMVGVCEKIGRILVRDFGELEKLQVSRKGLSDFVTSSDKKVEAIILEELSSLGVTQSFLTEEAGSINSSSSSKRWIVDPIDGTHNFMHGNPFFCTSIALEVDGEIVAGVVYMPILGETYWAHVDMGAFCIGADGYEVRIRASQRSSLALSLAAVNVPAMSGSPAAPYFHLIRDNGLKFRVTGSIALDFSYLSSGRFDIIVVDGVKPWDIAAGLILAKKSGAVVKNLSPVDSLVQSTSIVASNEMLNKTFERLI